MTAVTRWRKVELPDLTTNQHLLLLAYISIAVHPTELISKTTLRGTRRYLKQKVAATHADLERFINEDILISDDAALVKARDIAYAETNEELQAYLQGCEVVVTSAEGSVESYTYCVERFKANVGGYKTSTKTDYSLTNFPNGDWRGNVSTSCGEHIFSVPKGSEWKFMKAAVGAAPLGVYIQMNETYDGKTELGCITYDFATMGAVAKVFIELFEKTASGSELRLARGWVSEAAA